MTQSLKAELDVRCQSICDRGLGGRDRWAERRMGLSVEGQELLPYRDVD